MNASTPGGVNQIDDRRFISRSICLALECESAKRTKRREFRATPPEARVREISRRVTSNATTFRNVQQVDSERTTRERGKAAAAKCEVHTSSV